MTERCPVCDGPAARRPGGRKPVMECRACGLAFRRARRAERVVVARQAILWGDDDDAPRPARIDGPPTAG